MEVMTRLYNPTPFVIVGSFDGRQYYIEGGTSINLPDEVAWWILERFDRYGLVSISPLGKAKDVMKDKVKYLAFVVKKALEGLEKYSQTLNNALESFLLLDTELKQNNQHGTVLKCKSVRELTDKLNTITRLISDIEKKHGVSIAQQEYKDRSKLVLDSIDSQLKSFEEDEERKQKAAEDDAKANAVIKQIQDSMSESMKTISKKSVSLEG